MRCVFTISLHHCFQASATVRRRGAASSWAVLIHASSARALPRPRAVPRWGPRGFPWGPQGGPRVPRGALNGFKGILWEVPRAPLGPPWASCGIHPSDPWVPPRDPKVPPRDPWVPPRIPRVPPRDPWGDHRTPQGSLGC